MVVEIFEADISKNWQYLFIIEGSLTVVLATTAIFALPKNVVSSKYFTEAEKRCAASRKREEEEVNSVKSSWSDSLQPLGDWQVWMFGFMAVGVETLNDIFNLPKNENDK